MRPGIHPDYHPIVFRDKSADFAFLTRSTMTSSQTIQWEDGMPGVFQHVAGEGHRQVEMEAEFVRVPLLCVQAPDDIDLLVDLPLASQLVEGLDGPGLDGCEAVEFEG